MAQEIINDKGDLYHYFFDEEDNELLFIRLGNTSFNKNKK